MWRQKAPPGNRDSDEILSDDDGDEEMDRVTYDNDCGKNLQSLYSNGNQVQLTLPVLTRFKSLADKEKNPVFGAYDVNQRHRSSSPSTGKLENLSPSCMIRHGFQDEVELVQSLSHNQQHDEYGDDSISDEEDTMLSKFSVTHGAAATPVHSSCNLERENQPCIGTWSAVIGDAHKFDTISKRTISCSLSSETSASGTCKGGRGRARSKFSQHSLSHRLEQGTRENSMAELIEDLQEENAELPLKVISHDQRGVMPSISELLEDLQHKDGSPTGLPNSSLHHINATERRIQYARTRTLPQLGSRILDDEDSLEFWGGGFSSEDEDVDQNQLCLAEQTVKGHTMADLFQEAFSKSEMVEPTFARSKASGVGYFGRLQQVLQIEKDRQLELLKHIQTAQHPSRDLGCMNVQILSRLLMAKLTVCECSLDECTNSIQPMEDTSKCADVGTRKRTIIFNSKICDNVELEVGHFVRIHPPWKEVQVKEDDKVILCMYFSPATEGFNSRQPVQIKSPINNKSISST